MCGIIITILIGIIWIWKQSGPRSHFTYIVICMTLDNWFLTFTLSQLVSLDCRWHSFMKAGCHRHVQLHHIRASGRRECRGKQLGISIRNRGQVQTPLDGSKRKSNPVTWIKYERKCLSVGGKNYSNPQITPLYTPSVSVQVAPVSCFQSMEGVRCYDVTPLAGSQYVWKW